MDTYMIQCVFFFNRVKFNPIETLYHGLYQVYLNEMLTLLNLSSD